MAALPQDRPDPPVRSTRHERLRVDIGADLATDLRTMADRHGVTLPVLGLAGFALLLWRLSGPGTIHIGVFTPDRSSAALIVLPEPDGETHFADHLCAVSDRLARSPETGAAPARVAFGVVTEGAATAVPGADLTVLLVEEAGAGLSLHGFHAADIHDHDSIARLLARFVLLLQGIAADPACCLDAFDILPAAERQLIDGFSRGPTPEYPSGSTIDAEFAAIARADPGAIAIRQGGSRIDYGTLARWSDALAQRILAAGPVPGAPVAVTGERTPALIAGLLAALKCGAPYVVLDPALPPGRVASIVADSGAGCALVQPGTGLSLPPDFPQLPLDPRPQAPGPDPLPQAGPAPLAYLAYTSGSTGRPKGVRVPHRGVLRLVRGADYARLGPDERILQASSAAFDASTFEIWGALLNGGTLVQPPHGLPSLSELAGLIRDAGITTLWLTAGLFQQMVDHRPDCFAGVRQVLAGGDVLSPDHVARFLQAAPGCRLINGYGPTENVTFSTACTVRPEHLARGAIPIGRPIANSTAYVLDRHLRPVPIGVEGDLFVGGDGVAAGYLNLPEQTAAAFLDDPFSTAPGARMYRTGDRARFLGDGRIAFQGRADQQIKIRGYRVEPAEIEAALRAHPGIRDVAVVARRRGAEVRSLAAFVVARPGSAPPAAAALRRFLAGSLPDYMIPAEYRHLDALPLNPSGKIDRRRLLRLETDLAGAGRVAPRTPVEILLAGIWSDLLDRRDFGIDDDFFDIGGHSLLAMHLGFRLEEEIGLDMMQADFFRFTTIRSLAEALVRRMLAAEQSGVAGAAS